MDFIAAASRHELLTANEEIALGRAIREDKLALWVAILAYAPLTIEIFDAAYRAIYEGRCAQSTDLEPWPDGAAKKAIAASKAWRARQTKKNGDAWDKAKAGMAKEIASRDLDNEASDKIIKDLVSLAYGDRTLSFMEIKSQRPNRGSKPYADYVDDVLKVKRRFDHRRDRMVVSNIRLVRHLAKNWRSESLDADDMMNEGCIGLIKAVDRFDPERGLRFSTYASWWIKHSIRRANDNTGNLVRLPTKLGTEYSKVKAARRKYLAEFGRNPTKEELCKETGLDLKRVEAALKLGDRGIVSTDAKISYHQGSSPASSPSGPFRGESAAASSFMDSSIMEAQRESDIFQRINASLDFEEMRYCMDSYLSDKERVILQMRYGITDRAGQAEPLCLREVGEELGLSRERIRQIECVALKKMRTHMTPQIARA